MIFGSNGGFSKRNHLIFTEMKDLRRGSAGFSLKWGIPEEKTRDFRYKWGILEEKTRDFRLNGGFSKIKTRDFCLNGGFSKRKHVIFA